MPSSPLAPFTEALQQKALRRRQVKRVKRIQALLADTPPISCATPEDQAWRRRDMARMAGWDEAQWAIEDGHWAKLLTEVLADRRIDPQATQKELDDLSMGFQYARWNARHLLKNRPLSGPVYDVVWAAWNAPEVPNTKVLKMGVMACPSLSAELWRSAWAHPDDQRLLTLYSAFPLNLEIPVLVDCVPRASAERVGVFWKTVIMERSVILKQLALLPSEQGEPILEIFASQKETKTVRSDGANSPFANPWFYAVLNLSNAAQNQNEPVEKVAQALERLAKHGPKQPSQSVLKLWAETWVQDRQPDLYNFGQLPPHTWPVLDALVPALSTIFPIITWVEEQGLLEHLPRTQAQLRSQARAEELQAQPTAPARRRFRG